MAAALPGGDPLAEALAAGETPSPQMVAAAGETTGLAPRLAVASLAAVIVGLAAVVFIGLKVSGLELMNGLLPPEVLDQKAREIIEQARLLRPPPWTTPRMFYYNTDFTDYVHEHASRALTGRRFCRSGRRCSCIRTGKARVPGPGRLQYVPDAGRRHL